jgi:hypothetical protein
MTIEWSSLSYSHEEWKTMILPALLGALEGKVIQGARLLKEAEAGKDRWVYVLGTPQAPIGAGVVNCDSEFSVSITFARYKDIERQFAELDRIVKSVQCEVTDANRARPIAATRLPRKFGQTPDRDIQIFQALDGEQLMINFTQTDVQRNPFLYRQIMRSMLVNSIGIEFPEKDLKTLSPGSPSPAGKSSLMRLDFPATNETLYIGTQFCPEIDLSLISMWTAPGASDQLARERQSQVGCPGEESSATPTFASIADAACAAGEKQFCGLREMPE